MHLRILRGLRRINAMHMLCDHLFSEAHTHRHRMAVGFVVMWIGVIIAGFAGLFHVEHVRTLADCGTMCAHYSIDLVGYAIHGTGVVPFIETATMMLASTEE